MNSALQITILVTGFAIVIASSVWFALDLRKAKKLLLVAEAEKNELRSIIADAEVMVSELNNFSNHLLERIDSKNSEAEVFLDKLGKSLDNNEQEADGDDGDDDDGVGAEGDDTAWEAVGDVAAEADVEAAGDVAAEAAVEDYETEESVEDDEAEREEITIEVAEATTFNGDEGSEADAHMSADAHTVADARMNANAHTGVDARINASTHTGANTHTGVRGSSVGITGRRYKNSAIRHYINMKSGGFGDAGEPADAVFKTDAPVTDEVAPLAPLIVFPNSRAGHISAARSGRRNAPVSRSSKSMEVTRRFEEGMDEAEIAKELDIGRGEVALILGLREWRLYEGN